MPVLGRWGAGRYRHGTLGGARQGPGTTDRHMGPHPDRGNTREIRPDLLSGLLGACSNGRVG